MPQVSQVQSCAGCPMQRLQPTATFVPPKAGTSARCAIGEAPGEEESHAAEPFVGKSGKMLDGWFHKVGIARNDLWMANVLSCRPPSNLFPTDPKARKYISLADGRDAVHHCVEAHLRPFLWSRKWEKLYLIGAKALKYVAEKEPLFDWGGTPLPVPFLDPERRLAVATIHPAALMRESVMLPLVFADLRRPLEVPEEHYRLFPPTTSLKGYYKVPFAVDIETDIPPTRIHLYSLSNVTDEGDVMRFEGEAVEALRSLLAAAPEVVGQNLIQFDLPHLRRHGCPTSLNPDETVVWDIMLMHHLLWPELPHDLGSLGRQYLTKPFWKKWKQAADAEEVYAARDADATWQIFQKLKPELTKLPRLLSLYHNVQVPLARICHYMTEMGVMTDPAAARQMAEKADTVLMEQQALLPAHMQAQPLQKRRKVPAPKGTLTPLKLGKSGKPLKQRPVKWFYEPYEVMGPSPWRNGPRTAKFLYGPKEDGGLDLAEKLDGEGKVTTGKVALALLASHARKAGREEVAAQVNALRELRRWAARKTTCLKLSKGAAKRLHVSFNVHGTGTGRLSCSGDELKIQLQNQTEDMRVVYVPSQPGWKLISVDFSQMEARLAAWFAKDTTRAARFDLPGFNEYKYAASIFLGVPMEEVKKEKDPEAPYHQAKIIVLGMDRALGSRKISMQNDIPEAEVKKMQRRWREEIPATMRWQEAIGNEAKQRKLLYNPFGRRGLFYGGNAYTEGISFLPQSTGADVIFRCMIALMHQRVEWPLSRVEPLVPLIRTLPEPARLLIQVHDELVFEAPAGAVDEVVGVCKEVMHQPWPELDGLCLPVSASAGGNWLEMEDL